MCILTDTTDVELNSSKSFQQFPADSHYKIFCEIRKLLVIITIYL